MLAKLNLFASAFFLSCLVGAGFGKILLPNMPIVDPISICDCVLANGSSCCPEKIAPLETIEPVFQALDEPLEVEDEFMIMTCMCMFANGSSCCPEDFAKPTHTPRSLFACINVSDCYPGDSLPIEPISLCDCILANGSSCCPENMTIGPIGPIGTGFEPIYDGSLEIEDEFMIMTCMCMFANGSSCCPEDFVQPTHTPKSLFALACDCILENGTSCCPDTIEPVEPISLCDCILANGSSCCPENILPTGTIEPVFKAIDEPLEVEDEFMIMACMCMFANGTSCCPEDLTKPIHTPRSLLALSEDDALLCDCVMANGDSCC